MAAHAHAAACSRSARWSRPACRCCSRWPACSARAGCCSSAGQFARRVHLGDELRDDVRDRARDRLRAVHRRPLPRARSPTGLSPRDATVHTMATAGKAVLVSGLTVIAALLAVMLVPVPTFRSVPLGIVLAVLIGARRDAHAAARGAVARSATGSTAAGCACAARSTIAASASPPGAAGCGRGRCRTAPRPSRSCCFSPRPRSGCGPGCRPIAVAARTMPTRARATRSCSGRFGDGRAEPRSRSWSPSATWRAATVRARAAIPASPAVAPARAVGGHALLTAVPTAGDGSSRELRSTIDRRPRPSSPPARCVGGPAAETRDLEQALVSRLPLVVGVILGPRLPAAGRAAAGAARRRRRRRAQPARDRGGVRRRPARVPGRSARAAAGLRVAGLRRRVGADLLLRARLRAGDGLHGVPAGHGQGGPRPHRRRPPGASSRVWPARGA